MLSEVKESKRAVEMIRMLKAEEELETASEKMLMLKDSLHASMREILDREAIINDRKLLLHKWIEDLPYDVI